MLGLRNIVSVGTVHTSRKSTGSGWATMVDEGNYGPSEQVELVVVALQSRVEGIERQLENLTVIVTELSRNAADKVPVKALREDLERMGVNVKAIKDAALLNRLLLKQEIERSNHFGKKIAKHDDDLENTKSATEAVRSQTAFVETIACRAEGAANTAVRSACKAENNADLAREMACTVYMPVERVHQCFNIVLDWWSKLQAAFHFMARDRLVW